MMAGLTQATLKERIVKSIRDQTSIPPEILFSLYQSAEEMEPYLKFIYPEMISIERNTKDVIPKFFTFMSTDVEGSNSYFHCLVYYELFTKFDVLHDDDPKIDEMIERLKRKSKGRIGVNANLLKGLVQDLEDDNE